jgi:phage recombination protein Bet
MENLPATQMKEVRYQVEGREIVLTADLVKKYLVRGHGELMTGQEVAFFVGICRARGLDPFAGDVYVIKYAANDPAAIVISIDAVRARARMQDDCEGWTCGVIVQTKEGGTKDTAGLVMEGQKLLGGWAECTPKGWAVPMRLEVNLAAYIKKTNTGTVTKFWEPDKQPMMITKVAEMQLLRRIWPAALGKLYLREEVGISNMGEGETFDMISEGNGKQEPQEEKTPLDKFERLAHENGIPDITDLSKFIAASAKATGKTEDELMAAACKDFPTFLEIYRRNLQKKKEREVEAQAAKVEKKKKAAPPKEAAPPTGQGPFPEGELVNEKTGEVTQGDNGGFVVCSKSKGDELSRGYCGTNCKHFTSPDGTPQPMRCPDFTSESI